ncbi:MAG: carbon storage regulator [Pirellulales bacterium]|nr:carbon storage regulator [Pirellulales bacterium]
MLVLSRKIGQRIVLPDLGINLEVLEISQNRVRLGIEAPQCYPVYREEVWQRIRDEQTEIVREPLICSHACEFPIP